MVAHSHPCLFVLEGRGVGAKLMEFAAAGLGTEELWMGLLSDRSASMYGGGWDPRGGTNTEEQERTVIHGVDLVRVVLSVPR